jgi:hypothetical protein
MNTIRSQIRKIILTEFWMKLVPSGVLWYRMCFEFRYHTASCVENLNLFNKVNIDHSLYIESAILTKCLIT